MTFNEEREYKVKRVEEAKFREELVRLGVENKIREMLVSGEFDSKLIIACGSEIETANSNILYEQQRLKEFDESYEKAILKAEGVN